LVGTIFCLTAGILLFIAIIGSLSAQPIISLTAPGLTLNKANLSAKMLQVLMFTVPFSGLGILAEGVQNARNRFFWPAAARAIGSLGNVITILILYRTVGPLALAWGNLVSALLGACVPTIPMLWHGWKKLMPLRDNRVREIIRLIMPFLFFGIFTHSSLVFERYFASGLPDGDLSYIGYAYKISGIFVMVLATGIAAAIFPAMARSFTHDGEHALTGQAEYGFRLTLATALPVIAVLGTIAVPLVTVLYERGAFVHSDTLNVSRIVFIAMVGDVLLRMINNVTSRTFYVIKETLTFPMVSALTLVLYIFLGRALANAGGYFGLTLAKTLQQIIMTMIVFRLLTRKLPFFNLRMLFKDLLLYSIASLIAAMSAWFITWVITFQYALLQLLTGLIVAFPVYMLIIYWKDRDIAIALLELTGISKIVSAAQTGFQNIVVHRR
ncbi:MAG: murein biosynthesis integral membrane protein MurJ, partial [Planctomycetota bacterium]